MHIIETGHRWTRPLVALVALLLIVWTMRTTSSTRVVAPPEALGGGTTLQGQFQAQPAPSAAPISAAAADSAVAGRTPIVMLGQVALYTSDGSYSPDQLRDLAGPLGDALGYVSARTEMQLSAPVAIIFDRRDSCGLDGAAYTERRLIMLYACADMPTNRAVNILAHEFVHQLAYDHYGPAHMQADLILSEGLATWGAGKYWLGRESDFRGFVQHNYAAQLLPLGTHYRDIGTIDAMNRLYYQWASFVDFLISSRGRETFDALYRSGHGMQPNTADYSGVLGADLGGVEQQWKEWLSQ
jgi:hypothetical protein